MKEEETNDRAGLGLKWEVEKEMSEMPIWVKWEMQLFEGHRNVELWRVKNEKWRAWRDLSNAPKFGENEIFRKNTQFSY